MKKVIKIVFIGVTVILFFWVLKYFYTANNKAPEVFDTNTPFYTSISTKIVATGSLNPEEEIELKPQISGIVNTIAVEEGDLVNKGDLIATIRVVPNEQSLVSARSRLNSAKLSFDNANTLFNRNKLLYNKGVISMQDFESSELSFNQAKETLIQAQNDYQIIKEGSVSGGNSANTNIIAQISGTVLEIPVRIGDQVIQSNNFNAGTTIATIANMSNMIFEGTVDESEVGKLNEGQPINIVIGALDEKKLPAKLTFIAPKGISDNAGAVQFTIKGDVNIDITDKIRAGYSANAEIDLASKDSIFSIKESLVRFDRITEKPYVEILQADNTFAKKDIKLGLSDGINIEVLDGIKETDKIKVWNKASND
ncbi:HlyD family secretion protein [Hyunsoonleella jejuensis]|uniref:HlyD family secretion protein n=1 Tax=Hyunsoonleella jejuensis TaxID=419940 RepID=A0A1H9AAI0_9FLAO|nr:efflux RND transporter periplasmic adaptor subunit [Hyunsoonleella jejuensis]SEP73694.1 HlyD family secretion protein [Hyunsoonleella jejuensis]